MSNITKYTSEKYVNEAIIQAKESSKLFIINVTGSAADNNPCAYVLDKTFEEIKQAYDDGRELKCRLHCDVLLGGEDGEIIHGDGITLDLTDFYDDCFSFDKDIDGVDYKLKTFNGGTELGAVLSYLHAYYGTDPYTPTEDYHPATKKYVDDSRIQPDWNEEDETAPGYIANKPDIPTDAVHYTEQTLTDEQQVQVRTNIGAASQTEVDRLSEEIDDFFDGFEEIAIPEEGGTSSEGNTEISLESTMQYGKVDQAGRLDSTVTGYMHTDKIKLPDTKSFKFRCVNINGAIRYPDLRYVTAYDANGDVLPYNSQQNVVQGTTTGESPVVMDEIVDSVIITVANGHQYTEKTVILIEDEGHAASFSAIRTEKLSGFTTKFTLNDVRRGNHKSGVTDFTDPRSICTQGFVKPFVKSVKVISDVYRLAVVIFNDGLYVRTDSWFTNGLSCTFDHETYQYKLYISRVDGEYIYDFDGCRESIELTISTSDILYAYNELETKSDTERLRMRKILDSMMRRKYDISYANASAPLNLITYTGDNQIVHPKVLYFPSKFGKHKYWIAYNPYPFANGVYENPCIAYSDDGYEWTNIDGNPLDDPNGVGVNTDVHIVYNGTTNLLEVWWRYAAQEEGVDEYPEIIYRKTSADGLNWSEKEVVINNDSGDHVRYFSPCILHDGNKYKVWVVNSTDNTINYYEGTEATSLSKVRDITLNYQDSDITYRLWHIDVIEDGGKTVMVAMCKANTQLSQKQQIWSLFLTTSEDNINFETPKLVIIGNPYGWDKQIYRSSIVNVDGEYRIYYTAQDEKQRHGLGVCTSNKLSEFVGMI